MPACEPHWLRTLRYIFEQCTLVIMGYSGYDDFDVLPMIRKIKSTKPIVWVEHREDEDYVEILRMKEFAALEEDESGAFLRSRDELLYCLGLEKNRYKKNIYLVRTNTRKVMNILRVGYRIPPFNSEGEHNDLVIANFFYDWAEEFCKWKGVRELACATLFQDLGRLDDAMDMYAQAFEAAEKNTDKLLAAITLNNMSHIQRLRGDFGQALAGLKKSLSLHAQLGNELEVALTTMNIGLVHLRIAELSKARRAFREANTQLAKLGDVNGVARALTNLGHCQCEQGDYIAASHSYEEGYQAAVKCGDMEVIANALNGMGRVCYNQDSIDDAIQHFTKSIEIAQRVGNPIPAALSWLGLGQCLTKQGLLQEAAWSVSKAKMLFEDLGMANNVEYCQKFMRALYETDDTGVVEMVDHIVRLGKTFSSDHILEMQDIPLSSNKMLMGLRQRWSRNPNGTL